jgi:hypothetical protein
LSFRTIFCDVADILRTLTGPTVFDIRTAKLTIRTRTYPGGHRSSESAFIDSDLALPQIYKIRPLKTEEIASSGGKYEIGDLIVGPITPKGDTLGFDQSQLQPKPTVDGVDIIYIITDTTPNSTHSGEYSRVEFRSWRPFSVFLIIRRRVTKP